MKTSNVFSPITRYQHTIEKIFGIIVFQQVICFHSILIVYRELEAIIVLELSKTRLVHLTLKSSKRNELYLIEIVWKIDSKFKKYVFTTDIRPTTTASASTNYSINWQRKFKYV